MPHAHIAICVRAGHRRQVPTHIAICVRAEDGTGAGIDGAHYNSMPQEKSSLLKDAPPFAYYGRLGVIPFPKRLAERIVTPWE